MSESVALQSNEEKKFDLLLVSPNSNFDFRIQSVAKSYGYTFHKVATPDEASDSLEKVGINFIILDAAPANSQNEVVGFLQVLRYVFPKTPILVVFPKRFDKQVLQWVRKSGANFIMSDVEFMERVRFDFFVYQYVGNEYIPVKPHDFKLNTKVDLSLFYFMSANRRYYPIVVGNSILTEQKVEKIKKIGDVYVKRADIELYNRYLQNNQDQSANGLIRRCRLQFNHFKDAYLELVNHLTEEAEISSYDEGKKILDQCQKLSQDLMTAMMNAGSVFDVISQGLEGGFNFSTRAPERAAMVGFLSMMSDMGKPEHAILATLLCDIGLLAVPTDCLQELRKSGAQSLAGEMQRQYEQHPQFSINYAAQKKLQIDPIVREAILHSHSRLDGKGFPRVRGEKINVEAQLIQFVEILDEMCQVQWGKPRLNYKEELYKLLKDTNTWNILTPSLVQALKKMG